MMIEPKTKYYLNFRFFARITQLRIVIALVAVKMSLLESYATLSLLSFVRADRVSDYTHFDTCSISHSIK